MCPQLIWVWDRFILSPTPSLLSKLRRTSIFSFISAPAFSVEVGANPPANGYIRKNYTSIETTNQVRGWSSPNLNCVIPSIISSNYSDKCFVAGWLEERIFGAVLGFKSQVTMWHQRDLHTVVTARALSSLDDLLHHWCLCCLYACTRFLLSAPHHLPSQRFILVWWE